MPPKPIRRSGLQQSVINLYRDCWRAIRMKSPETRTRFQSFVRVQFKRSDVTAKDHIAIEYLIRRGKKQLETYSEKSIKDISGSHDDDSGGGKGGGGHE
ncbi:hypothetical protein G9A89_011862 [Geosiphon pyriformis]|nr:hypothetical protein G9A89_011862 [Geosiphon pyriformis]